MHRTTTEINDVKAQHIFVRYVWNTADNPQATNFTAALREYNKHSDRLFEDMEKIQKRMGMLHGKQFEMIWAEHQEILLRCLKTLPACPFGEEAIKAVLKTVSNTLDELTQPIRSAFIEKIAEELPEVDEEIRKDVNEVIAKYKVRLYLFLIIKFEHKWQRTLHHCIRDAVIADVDPYQEFTMILRAIFVKAQFSLNSLTDAKHILDAKLAEELYLVELQAVLGKIEEQKIKLLPFFAIHPIYNILHDMGATTVHHEMCEEVRRLLVEAFKVNMPNYFQDIDDTYEKNPKLLAIDTYLNTLFAILSLHDSKNALAEIKSDIVDKIIAIAEKEGVQSELWKRTKVACRNICVDLWNRVRDAHVSGIKIEPPKRVNFSAPLSPRNLAAMKVEKQMYCLDYANKLGGDTKKISPLKQSASSGLTMFNSPSPEKDEQPKVITGKFKSN